jgi:mono/diheme cytochrome c family protein
MKWFVLFLVVFGMVKQDQEWIAPSSADTLKNTQKKTDKNIAAGKKTFEKLCAVCHGTTGKGDGISASSLKIKPADFSEEKIQKQSDGAIYWKISEGRGEMSNYKNLLTSKERWQLVLFIRTLK